MVGSVETACSPPDAGLHTITTWPTIELRAPATTTTSRRSRRVIDAQDTAWWGAPDGDIDDVRDELDRVRRAIGFDSRSGARVAVVDGSAWSASRWLSVTVTRRSPSTRRRPTLSVVFGGAVRLARRTRRRPRSSRRRRTPSGWRPGRRSDSCRGGRASSSNGPATSPTCRTACGPTGIVPVPFRLGVDDEELHEMIYSFWTDVPGHTDRPIDEWRASILAGPWFDAGSRRDRPRGRRWPARSSGCALGRTFAGDVGWVSQLGVARSARGLGLGRAILIESCRRLGANGAEHHRPRCRGRERQCARAVPQRRLRDLPGSGSTVTT